MKFLYPYALILVGCLLSTELHADAADTSRLDILLNHQVEQVELQKQLNFELALIKSKDDLFQALQDHSISGLLSNGGLSVFTNSATFNEHGLSGFDYSPLEAELTPTQIYRFLSLFGKQHVAHKLDKARIETDTDRLILKYGKPVTSLPEFSAMSPTVIRNPGSDHTNYRCVERATCYVADNHICLSSC